MGENLSKRQSNILTILITLLLAFVTIATGIQGIYITNQNHAIAQMQTTVSSMPREYVQLERYKADQARQIATLDKIDSKLDKLIMERGKK